MRNKEELSIKSEFVRKKYKERERKERRVK